MAGHPVHDYQGVCPSCGYSLAGLPTKKGGVVACPECGSVSQSVGNIPKGASTIEVRAASPLYSSRTIQAAAALFVCVLAAFMVIIILDLPLYFALLSVIPPAVVALLPRRKALSIRVDKGVITLTPRHGPAVEFPAQDLLLIAQRLVPSLETLLPGKKREPGEGPQPLMQPRRIRIATEKVDVAITFERRDAEALFTSLRRVARRAIIYPATGRLFVSREFLRAEAVTGYARAAILVRHETSRQVFRASAACLSALGICILPLVIIVAPLLNPRIHGVSGSGGRGAGVMIAIGVPVAWATGRHAVRTWRRGRACAADLHDFEIAALSESAGV